MLGTLLFVNITWLTLPITSQGRFCYDSNTHITAEESETIKWQISQPTGYGPSLTGPRSLVLQPLIFPLMWPTTGRGFLAKCKGKGKVQPLAVSPLPPPLCGLPPEHLAQGYQTSLRLQHTHTDFRDRQIEDGPIRKRNLNSLYLDIPGRGRKKQAGVPD